MLQRIQEYTVDHIGVPTNEEIKQAIQAKMYMPDTVHILKWYVEYSGGYQVDILKSDETPDDVRKRMPKAYGL